MTLDDIQAEISSLVNEMEDHPEDRRELYTQFHQKMNAVRAMGMPVPDNLRKLERQLQADCCAESQGR